MKTGFPTHMLLIDVQDDFDDNTKRLIYVTQEDPPLQQGYEPTNEDEIRTLQAYETMMVAAVKILAEDAKSCVTDAEIQADVKSIIEFERQLSKIINQDPEKLGGAQLIRRMRISDVHTFFPAIDFMRLLREVLPPDIASNVDGNFEVSVPEAPFLQKLNSLLQRTDSRTVTNYLMWRYVKDNMDEGVADQRLSDVVQQQQLFAYRRKHRRHKLRRALGVTDRESACITETQKRLGNIAGAIYARRYFSKADRAPVCQEMKDLKEAFRQILQQNTWMDDNTKRLAVTKLDNMLLNAGAPDQVYDDLKLDKEYEGLSFHYSDSYATMKHKMIKWASDSSLAEVNRTVNRREKYLLAPTEINAFAAQNANAVFLLAGILQQPLVYNYGAIGSIVGHELTHNYDNIGALFDQVGNQKQWWDAATFREFETRKQCLIDQYSKFSVPEASNEKVDGEKTQGENIGDLGGVKEAFLAFQNHIRQTGPEPPLPGLERYTPQQLFFLAMARVNTTILLLCLN
ncbi:Protein NEP-11 b [Aphelenchoides avenae]|nr:Protein NEP-11 b [Aphelenchus avenae]